MKLLNKKYSSAADNNKIKIMDGYGAMLKNEICEVKNLSKKIEKKEKNMPLGFPEEYLLTIEKKLIINFYKINKSIKILKENFYRFIIENHHEAK